MCDSRVAPETKSVFIQTSAHTVESQRGAISSSGVGVDEMHFCEPESFCPPTTASPKVEAHLKMNGDPRLL